MYDVWQAKLMEEIGDLMYLSEAEKLKQGIPSLQLILDPPPVGADHGWSPVSSRLWSQFPRDVRQQFPLALCLNCRESAAISFWCLATAVECTIWMLL